MFKHANTFFPDQRVVSTDAKVKIAELQPSGRVLTADAETGKVKVAWDGGVEEWVDPSQLSKEPEKP